MNEVVTKEMVAEDIRRLHDSYGQVTTEIYDKHSKYSKYYLQRHFKGLKKAHEELGLDFVNIKKGKRNGTKEEFLEDLKRVYEEQGSLSVDMYKEYGKYGSGYFHHYCGGIKNAMKMIDLEWKPANLIDDDLIREDLYRVYREHGYLHKTLYEEAGKYSVSAVKHRYGTFNGMLKELGMPINMNKNITKEEVIESMTELYNKHGYLNAELQRKESFSQPVIENLFGGFNNLLIEMGLDLNNVRIDEDSLKSELLKIYSTYGYLNKTVIDHECSTSYEACAARLGGKSGISNFLKIPACDLLKVKSVNSE